MSYFYQGSDVLYSAACSDNVYLKIGQRLSFQKMQGQDYLIEVLHLKSRERYLCCSFRSLSAPRESFYLNAVSKPMQKGFIWPIDVAVSNNEKYLVFRQTFSVDRSFTNMLMYTRGEYQGFQDPNAQQIIFTYLNSLQNLYDNGYVYRLWDERNIFIGQQSNELIFQFNDAMSLKTNPMHLEQNEYYTELTDPYICNNDKNYDFYSDMYSYQSLLFKLLIGIYPFEGERLVGYERNGTETELSGWILEYMRNIYFIFDDDDSRNQIGVMGQDIPRVKRWESLPPTIQAMFRLVFDRSNVLRESGKIQYFEPRQWYEELRKFNFQIKE